MQLFTSVNSPSLLTDSVKRRSLYANKAMDNPRKILGNSPSTIKNLNETFSMARVREILARNIIADFVLRSHERRRVRKGEARSVIIDFLWRIIALRRRRRFRASAVLVQKMQRGHAARRVHLERVQARIENFRQFNSVWKQAIDQVPETTGRSLSGWSLVRELIDLRRVEMIDDDGDFAETDQKLNEALTGALRVNGDGDGISEVNELRIVVAAEARRPCLSGATTTAPAGAFRHGLRASYSSSIIIIRKSLLFLSPVGKFASRSIPP